MRGAREITAFILVPIALAVIVVLPPWVYLAAVWLLCTLAAWELLALLRLRHPVPVGPTLVVLGAALAGTWLVGLERAGWILAAAVLVVPLVYLLGRYPIAGAAAGIAGAIPSDQNVVEQERRLPRSSMRRHPHTLDLLD